MAFNTREVLNRKSKRRVDFERNYKGSKGQIVLATNFLKLFLFLESSQNILGCLCLPTP